MQTINKINYKTRMNKIHNTDVLHDDDDHIAIDPIADGTSVQLEKSITELLPMSLYQMKR